MNRIGLCGGTFDPVHNGHVALAEAALASGQVDQCIIMPAGRPPHKIKQHVSPAIYRLIMAEEAYAGQAGITVSDLEICQKGRSYTLDTVKRLLPTLPAGSELVLIYGSDILLDLEKWHRPQDILDLCPLLLARRGGYDSDKIDVLADRIRIKFHAKIDFFDCPAMDLSSSRIRQSIACGKSWRSQVPEAVAEFIEKNALYQYQLEIEALPFDLWQDLLDLEQQLWPILTRRRLLHSLNVMILSLHLAMKHQISLRQSGIAGILHDCAKCLPVKKQQTLAQQAGDLSLLKSDLAHAPAGMVLAENDFAVTDPEILKAIICHTTACPDMSRLAQILFLADKIEPARHYLRLDPIRELAEDDLDQAMMLCLEEIVVFLRRSHLKIHPYTLAAMRETEQKIKLRTDPKVET